MTRQGATLSELCAEDDPRWKLAYSEAFGPLPELSSFSKLEFRSWALFRQHEIKVIYDLGIPDASPLSFRSNEWRSAVPGAGSAPVKPVRWDSDRFADFWNRIVYYQIQIHYGSGLDSRQVVRALAESRREWQAQRTVEHAKWLRDRHLNHAKRHLTRLKAEVMKGRRPLHLLRGRESPHGRPRRSHVPWWSRSATEPRDRLQVLQQPEEQPDA